MASIGDEHLIGVFEELGNQKDVFAEHQIILLSRDCCGGLVFFGACAQTQIVSPHLSSDMTVFITAPMSHSHELAIPTFQVFKVAIGENPFQVL